MKITSVETFIAGPDRRNYLFVRVQTDEGIHGIGEAYSCGPDEARAAVIPDFEDWLIGQDPARHRGALAPDVRRLALPRRRRPQRGASAASSTRSGTSGARRSACRSSELLGGQCRDRIRVYQSRRTARPRRSWQTTPSRLIERYGYTRAEDRAAAARLRPPCRATRVVREAAKRLEAVREAVGDDIEIGVDAARPHLRAGPCAGSWPRR